MSGTAQSQNEQMLIGSTLVGADIDLLSTIVKPADFYHPVHEVLWSAILAVHDEGEAVEVAKVLTAAARDHPEARVDPMVLLDAQTIAPAAPSGTWYARQVSEAALRRRVTAAAARVQQLAASPEIGVDELRSQSMHALETALVDNAPTVLARLGDVVDEVVAIAEGKRKQPVLPTGWTDLDDIIGGLAPGRLVVIGARPGVGKSVAGTNLALQFAGKHRHGVLVASMEMTRVEVAQRMVAADARVNLTRLSEATTNDDEWTSIAKRHDALRAMPVYIHDAAAMTVPSIRAHANELRRKGVTLAVIVVDYLQLMEATGRTGNRVEAVGQISRGLKNLASETNTCVVAMSQLNRESLKNGDGRPRISELRESGSIEQDANVVILLHRPDDDLPEVEAIVAKNRHGRMGTATLLFEGHYATFRDNQWTPTRGMTA